MKVVISQPMFFPWVGLFEQIRLADVSVHYDDVQFSKGSFVNRVEIKTPDGFRWLTVPLRGLKLGQLIKDVTIDESQNWRNRHLAFLKQVYSKAPFVTDMLAIVERVYGRPAGLCDLIISSMYEVCEYFDLAPNTQFLISSQLGIGGRGGRRVLDIVKFVGGSVYVTGHGASNYLDHELFEANGVRVEYMNYQRKPYPQLYGEFNPHVSVLDLIANVGKAGKDVICSGTIYWRDLIGNDRAK